MEANRLGCSKGVIVVLDTNTLILMAAGVIPPSLLAETLESSHELVAPTAVKEELERLSASHPRSLTRRRARAALNLAERLSVTWVNTTLKEADDAIEELARALKAEGCRVVVATSDRSLRRRLRSIGVPTLYYRESEGRLELDWSPL
ncbi:MAG: PIN domain-containing protein [Desulfurococcales archaeon]|nr:PIN domain-containing protein [Desulfurococcales archaeon]